MFFSTASLISDNAPTKSLSDISRSNKELKLSFSNKHFKTLYTSSLTLAILPVPVSKNINFFSTESFT
ncbi:hypothetical protein JQ035_15255 [Clostridium botulinum]|nr:hypothetical protein [Clostridium botulinum]